MRGSLLDIMKRWRARMAFPSACFSRYKDPMHAVFRFDANRQIGLGHMFRCNVLASKLIDKGARVTFAVSSGSVYPSEQSGRLYKTAILEKSPLSFGEANAVSSNVAAIDEQEADAAALIDAVGEPDLVVVDHYRLDYHWEACWPKSKVLVIDDLADRRHHCFALLNQNIGAERAMYNQLVGNDCLFLLGPMFALLRSEFAERRKEALFSRARLKSAGRVFVNFGGTDASNLTLETMIKLSAINRIKRIDVAIGSLACDLPEIRAFAATKSTIRLHIDALNMAELMADADLAIGAGGSTSWERCVLGLPSIVFQVAPNQAALSSQLCDAGAAISISDMGRLPQVVENTLANSAALATMSAVAASICDGRGAVRLADHLWQDRNETLNIRPADAGDVLDLWTWRNDLDARRMAFQTMPLPLASHMHWFEATMRSAHVKMYIGEQGDEKIGMVRFDVSDASALVSVNISPAWRNRGIARQLLRKTIQHFERYHSGIALRAQIRSENRASQKVFAALGFVLENETDGVQEYWLKERANRNIVA